MIHYIIYILYMLIFIVWIYIHIDMQCYVIWCVDDWRIPPFFWRTGGSFQTQLRIGMSGNEYFRFQRDQDEEQTIYPAAGLLKKMWLCLKMVKKGSNSHIAMGNTMMKQDILWYLFSKPFFKGEHDLTGNDSDVKMIPKLIRCHSWAVSWWETTKKNVYLVVSNMNGLELPFH